MRVHRDEKSCIDEREETYNIYQRLIPACLNSHIAAQHDEDLDTYILKILFSYFRSCFFFESRMTIRFSIRSKISTIGMGDNARMKR